MFEAVQMTMLGYKLIDKGSGIWQIRTPRGSFTGSLAQVKTYSVVALGFNMKELDTGLDEMEKNFHNAAEYGVMKRFIYTEDLHEKSTRH